MAADPSVPCINRLHSDFFIAKQIGPKIALHGEPTMEMMADRTKPSDEQLQAISSYASTRQSCWSLGGSYRQANMPASVVLVLDQRVQAKSVLLSKLYAGEITFGEFNTRTAENTTAARAGLIEIDRGIEQTNAQNDAARRAAASSALQNMQNQQLIQQQQRAYQMPLPRQTTCTSQRIGNQVQTVCQ